MALCISLFPTTVQLDPQDVPPFITNKLVQRQVMAICNIRDILTPPTPTPSPLSHCHGNTQPRQGLVSGKTRNRRGREEDGEDQNGIIRDGQLGNGADVSGAHFEDPVSLYAFTRSNMDTKRMESVPWDVDHHWNGDMHSHTHLEAREVSASTGRARSYSEGESASLGSIPVSQDTQHMLATIDEMRDKGQLT